MTRSSCSGYSVICSTHPRKSAFSFSVYSHCLKPCEFPPSITVHLSSETGLVPLNFGVLFFVCFGGGVRVGEGCSTERKVLLQFTSKVCNENHDTIKQKN